MHYIRKIGILIIQRNIQCRVLRKCFRFYLVFVTAIFGLLWLPSLVVNDSSYRNVDKSTKETDPKKELDKALFNRMQDLLKKKRDFQKEKSKQQEAIVSFYSNILAGEPV